MIAWVFVLPGYPGVLALFLAQLGDPAKADQLLRRRALRGDRRQMRRKRLLFLVHGFAAAEFFGMIFFRYKENVLCL